MPTIPESDIDHFEVGGNPEVPINDAFDSIYGKDGKWYVAATADADVNLSTLVETGKLVAHKYKVFEFTGAMTADRAVTLPNAMGQYAAWNNTTGGFKLTFATVAAGASVDVLAGEKVLLAVDPGNDVHDFGGQGSKIKITSSDTTARELNDKVVVVGDLAKATLNPAGDEDLELTAFLPAGYITGFALLNGTDAAHDIDHGVGECRGDGDTNDAVLSSTLVKQIDAAWAEGTALGGLFSGTVANDTWYHNLLIRKNSDGTIDGGFDTSITGANKPSGWTVMKRLGSVLSDGTANILGFTHLAEHGIFLWDDPPLDITVADQSTTAVLRTLSVPPGIRVKALVRVRISHASAQRLVLLRSPDSDDEAPSASAAPLLSLVTGSGGGEVFGDFEVYTNTSGQIATRADGTATDLDIVTLGWQEAPGLGSQAGGSVGSGKVLIEEIVASAAADVQFVTGIDSTYDIYELEIIDAQPTTDAAALELAVTEDGGTWKVGASDYEWAYHFVYESVEGVDADPNQTEIKIAGNIDTAASEGNAEGTVTFRQPAGTTRHKRFRVDVVFWNNDLLKDTSYTGWAKYKGTTNAIDGIRIKASTGNINGTFRLWGLPKT